MKQKASIANTNSQIQLIDNDKSKLQSKTAEYTTKINNLQKVNDKINDINKTKNAIPNLLNQINVYNAKRCSNNFYTKIHQIHI